MPSLDWLGLELVNAAFAADESATPRELRDELRFALAELAKARRGQEDAVIARDVAREALGAWKAFVAMGRARS